MELHLHCTLLVFNILIVSAILPIPELHFKDKIISDEDTEITCTLRYTDNMEVTLEIKGKTKLTVCVQNTLPQSNNVIYTNKTCTVEVTEEMDEMEFTCEAHFKTQSKPAKMYLQSEPTITDCPDKLVWIDGQENSFHCKAKGYPAPTVTCEKGSSKYMEGVNYRTTRNMTGNYTCSAKNHDIDKKSVEVLVQYKPKVSDIEVNPPLHNEGDTLTMTCEADGVPAPAYSWKTPSSDIQFSLNKTTITVHSLKKSHLGKYMCTASNKHGSHSLEKELTLAVQPQILDINGKKNLEEITGNNVTLSCQASGFPPPTFSWDHPKAEFELSEDGSTLQLWNVNKKHTGEYSCTAQNKHGNATQKWKITVTEKRNKGERREMSIAILSMLIFTSLMFCLF
ncbi:limbic system-associated membrane protein-like [Rhinoderma darwinii]|uniref:limbic system-associated membrane protein-like n=1 Tax=Rhinoderma darwinii TaxID=43563 RepID=UPI003F66A971